MKKNLLLGIFTTVFLTACGQQTPAYVAPAVSGVSTLEPIGTVYSEHSYAGEEAQPEAALETFVSEDGRCMIEKKPSYYEVYLDYTDGDYYAAGKAYAETMLDMELDISGVIEPYLFENIDHAFPNLDGNYKPVEDRIYELMKNVPADYKKEFDGFAKTISGGINGIANDGILSYEEALLIQMVPDCLRENNCNALTVWGEKSADGGRMFSRTMEWSLGSEKQMCTVHAVTHFKMGEGKNSYTTFGTLAMLDILAGMNEKGVFGAILDSGSYFDYVCEGKKCYTLELRYALEHMDSAREIGEYMVSESKNFTFSHNVLLTDPKESLVAEDCANLQGDVPKQSILRDQYTPLREGVSWDSPDSMGVVNAFVTEGSDDELSVSASNWVRFNKLNTWVSEYDKMSFSDLKDLVTRERPEYESGIQKIYSDIVFHIIVYDYATDELEVTFTGMDGIVDHPKFVRIEHRF